MDLTDSEIGAKQRLSTEHRAGRISHQMKNKLTRIMKYLQHRLSCREYKFAGDLRALYYNP
jgi:hypothetical protein